MKKRSRTRKKENRFPLVVVFLIVVAFICYIAYSNSDTILNSSITNKNTTTDNKSSKNNSSTKEDTSSSTKDTSSSQSSQKKEEAQKNKQESEKTKEYTFDSQTSQDEVKVEANKVVEATGFAGASNYKFYLRGTTLYFKDVSSGNPEEILAYNVRDIYLKNNEVTAKLYSDGKIVKENDYIDYEK